MYKFPVVRCVAVSGSIRKSGVVLRRKIAYSNLDYTLETYTGYDVGLYQVLAMPLLPYLFTIVTGL